MRMNIHKCVYGQFDFRKENQIWVYFNSLAQTILKLKMLNDFIVVFVYIYL